MTQKKLFFKSIWGVITILIIVVIAIVLVTLKQQKVSQTTDSIDTQTPTIVTESSTTKEILQKAISETTGTESLNEEDMKELEAILESVINE